MATNYYNAQIGVVDASGNVNVIYPITKAANVDLAATSYSTVEACLAALGTAAFRNASDTYTATGSTVATTKAVYDAYTTLNSKLTPSLYKIEFKYDWISGNPSDSEAMDYKIARVVFISTSTLNLSSIAKRYYIESKYNEVMTSGNNKLNVIVPIVFASFMPWPNSGVANAWSLVTPNFIYAAGNTISSSYTWKLQTHLGADTGNWQKWFKQQTNDKVYVFIDKQ